ncbi:MULTISPECIES: hypothetical protein [unclassified Xanthobacter]|uniref:hypothetical protein n=1 Tax=unclassified Xanthobacter TaxID=2623496 RepID=UPI001EDD760E|nr:MULTISPECIES: hypothetical protein [unclassified Xanthobacter]
MKSLSSAQVARIRELAVNGLHVDEIAAASGLSKKSVYAAARQAGVDISGAVIVPNWVPFDLEEDWRDLRKSMGRTWADRAVRRLMAGGL